MIMVSLPLGNPKYRAHNLALPMGELAKIGSSEPVLPERRNSPQPLSGPA
jgi:hypothetical protein